MRVNCICSVTTDEQFETANELCGESLKKTPTGTYELKKWFRTKRDAQRWMIGRVYELNKEDLCNEMIHDVFNRSMLRYKDVCIFIKRDF
jgi:hypothetical protein